MISTAYPCCCRHPMRLSPDRTRSCHHKQSVKVEPRTHKQPVKMYPQAQKSVEIFQKAHTRNGRLLGQPTVRSDLSLNMALPTCRERSRSSAVPVQSTAITSNLSETAVPVQSTAITSNLSEAPEESQATAGGLGNVNTQGRLRASVEWTTVSFCGLLLVSPLTF